MSVRIIRRSPLFCAMVVAILGLGTGAGALIFTAIDAFVLRPLPVAGPDRLARLGVEISPVNVSFEQSGMYERMLAERARSFEAVFSFFPMDAAFVGGNHVETVTCERVSVVGVIDFGGLDLDRSICRACTRFGWRNARLAGRYPEEAPGRCVKSAGAVSPRRRVGRIVSLCRSTAGNFWPPRPLPPPRRAAPTWSCS